jgi:hypothetical protein
MPLPEIAQNHPVNRMIRLNQSTAELIDQYRANFQVSAEEFVTRALTYVFSRHRDFRKFLRGMESRSAAPRCSKRKSPQNGTGSGVALEVLERVAEAAKALETVSAPRPHG